MPKIIVYTGLSNCGKTTVINPVFKERGYMIVSSNQCVNKITEDFARILCGTDIDLQDKDLHYRFGVSPIPCDHTYGTVFSRRKLLVTIAEEIIKPNLGKDVFARKAAEIVSNCVWSNIPVAYECFFPEYYQFLESLHKFTGSTTCTKLNIVSDLAIDANDGRKYFNLPDYTYVNNQHENIERAKEEFNCWLDTHGF